MKQDGPAPSFDEVGYVEPGTDMLVIRLNNSPDKYLVNRDEMGYLMKGVTMNETIRIRRRDEGQSVLFGDVAELPGGTATLTFSKKSIRLNLPGDERMLLIVISKLQKMMNREEPSCPVIQMRKAVVA